MATALRKKYPDKHKKVGFYAYNAHCAPPVIEVDPDVIVSICTGFLQSGWEPVALTNAWQAKKAVTGIREYYGGGPVPGTGALSNLAHLDRTIKTFYDGGARYLIAECQNSFGTTMLGQYFASRKLWNVNTGIAETVDDFLASAFPKSQEAIRTYFRLVNGNERPPFSEDFIARMYESLAQAKKLAKASPAESARLDDLICYTRFTELMLKNPTRSSLANYMKLMTFADSIRGTQMVHSYAFYRDNRPFLEPYLKKQAKGKVAWKQNRPPTSKEIANFLASGSKNNRKLDFETRSFSTNLKCYKPGGKNRFGSLEPVRGTNEFYFWSNAHPVHTQSHRRTDSLVPQSRQREDNGYPDWRRIRTRRT